MIRSDHFEDLPSLTGCPLTTALRADVPDLRIDVLPGEATGLREPSQIAVDKITTVAVAKVGGVIGRADEETMRAIDRAVLVYLGLV